MSCISKTYLTLSKFATDPNVTTPGHPNNFFRNAVIGDIQALNGQPVMGTFTSTGPGGAYLRTTPHGRPGTRGYGAEWSASR